MQLGKCLVLLGAATGLLAFQAPLADPVVAVIDGREIRKSEIDAILYIAPPDFIRSYQQNPQEALGSWFLLRHLGDLGLERGLDKQSPTKEQLDVMIHDVLARVVINNEENTYPVSNEMIEEYYRTHAGRFNETKLKGIVVRFQPKTQGPAATQDLQNIAKSLFEKLRAEDEELIIAEDIVKKLREGADFDALVAQYSEDPESKTQGGTLPPVRIDSAHPADFRNAVDALQVGQFSNPLRQNSAYYIVKVEERGLRPIADTRSEIIMAIRREHRDAWIRQLGTRFKVEVKDPSFFQPKLPGFDASKLKGLPQQ